MFPETSANFAFGDVVADCNLLEIRREGKSLELEPKAVRVLLYLIRHRGRVVTKDELIREVWTGTFVTDNALTRVIAQIRKQLGDSARSPRYIETSATTGYRFIAEVREEATGMPLRVQAESAGRSRHRVAIGLGVVALAGIAGWLLTASAGAPVKLAGLRQITTSTAADLWPTFSPDGNQVAFSSDRSGTFEIYVRSLAPGAIDRQVTSDGQENIQPAWSPDGQYLAYVARRRGGIAVIPVSGGAVRYLTEQGDTPAWSPDGRLVAYRAASLDLNPAIETTGIGETTIWMVGADGSGARPLTRTGIPPGGHNFPHWAPGGGRVIFSANKLWEVEIATGKLDEIRVAAHTVRSPAISADNRQLYWVGYGGQEPGLWHARMVGRHAGTPEILVPAGGPTPRDLTLSADGKRLAFSQQVGESAIWSVSLKADGTPAAEPRPLIRDRSFRNWDPAFSADGSKIAYSSIRPGGEAGVYVAGSDGSNPLAVTAPDENSSRPTWRGREMTLGYRSGSKGEWSYRILPLPGKSSRLYLKLDRQQADRMKLSPDGSMMLAHVSTAAGFQVVVEDLATHVIRKLTPAESSYGYPSWSKDGKWIAAEQRVGGRNEAVYLSSGSGEIRKLNTGVEQALVHDWSPDSDKISFAGLRNGVWNVYWISVSSGKVQQLTHFTSHSAFVRYPAWSPHNDQIVFENNDVSANVYLAQLR